eukprot:scaffold93506_cov35-Cyclotella_meneghiniana.AAC.1
MKFIIFSTILATIVSASATSTPLSALISVKGAEGESNSNNSHLKCDLLLQGYTYEDIREQELKCKAENREFKYDAATNTWSCPPT